LRGHDQQRNVAIFVELPFFAHFEALNRRIPTPPQCQVDPLQHGVVDFEALLERDLAERLIDRLRQVQARVERDTTIRPSEYVSGTLGTPLGGTPAAPLSRRRPRQKMSSTQFSAAKQLLLHYQGPAAPLRIRS
jgi:hypothetical protein